MSYTLSSNLSTVRWLTNEIEYEGFPLLLRKPEYRNIWRFKNKFPLLVSVEHHLSNTSNNGLPETNYNKTLADFDAYMCEAFENSNNGLIILVETFGGKRNYYYYTLTEFDINILIKKVQEKFNVILTTWQKIDSDWGFLDAYPIELFNK